jgi:glycosyltransferase involved in cell wall biosynthesis
MPTCRKLISIVTPCYNEEDNVADCHLAVKELFERQLPEYDFEHIFCDNASTDRTPDLLADLAGRDLRVKVIFNARNFGPFCSTFNGLTATSGDAVVVLLAADLQDPPELIVDFVRRWEQGYQVVYGIRQRREEGFFMRRIRRAYYWIVSKFADINIPPNVGEFQLVDRVIVDHLRRFDDHYPYIRGMIANCGFKATGIEYTWKARKKGFSKNRLYHLVDQGLNGLVSFTKVPLRLCLLSGFLLSVFSILYALVSLIIHIAHAGKLAPPGIATLIVAIFFFSGVQLFFFGILGEYIAAVHFQVRKRPLVIERGRLNFDQPHRTDWEDAPLAA